MITQTPVQKGDMNRGTVSRTSTHESCWLSEYVCVFFIVWDRSPAEELTGGGIVRIHIQHVLHSHA